MISAMLALILTSFLTLESPSLCVAVSVATTQGIFEAPGVDVSLSIAPGAPLKAFTDERGSVCFRGNFVDKTVHVHANGGLLGDDADYDLCVQVGWTVLPLMI